MLVALDSPMVYVFIAFEVHLLMLKIVQVPSPIVPIAMVGFVKIAIVSIRVVVAIATTLKQVLAYQLRRKCLGCLGQGLYLLGQRFVTIPLSFLFLLQMNLQLHQLLHSLIRHHLEIL